MKRFVEHPLIKGEAIEAREYQTLLGKAVLEKGNTLIVAPTALGKTIIAIVVAVQLLEKKQGKVLFLAPTKPLVEQHKKSFEKKTTIPKERIIALTGTVPQKQRKKLFEKAIVISATPQTIRNDLRQGAISMENVVLCIFDEAHRAIGKYAYVEIAERYVKEAKNPLVLALTASPGSEEEKIREVCKNLFIKNIEVKSVSDIDVKPFVQEVETNWVRVSLGKDFLRIKMLLESFLKEQIFALKRMGLVPTANPNYFSKKRQLELQQALRERIERHGRQQPSLFAAATRVAALMKASHALLLLETQGISALTDFLERAEKNAREEKASRALKLFLKSKEIQRAIALAKRLQEQGIEHPKISALGKILEEQFKKNPESRAIVFNHYRSSIKKLTEFLEACPHVKPKRFIGQATREADSGMSQKEQIRAIEELKHGKYNCLIASSVAEEGLDIPAVDLVVFYEPVPSEIRAIQRRGRTGRLSKGKVIVLMAEKTRDEAFYWVSLHKEKRMHRTLHELKKEGKESEKPKTQEKQTKLWDWK